MTDTETVERVPLVKVIVVLILLISGVTIVFLSLNSTEPTTEFSDTFTFNNPHSEDVGHVSIDFISDCNLTIDYVNDSNLICSYEVVFYEPISTNPLRFNKMNKRLQIRPIGITSWEEFRFLKVEELHVHLGTSINYIISAYCINMNTNVNLSLGRCYRFSYNTNGTLALTVDDSIQITNSLELDIGTTTPSPYELPINNLFLNVDLPENTTARAEFHMTHLDFMEFVGWHQDYEYYRVGTDLIEPYLKIYAAGYRATVWFHD